MKRSLAFYLSLMALIACLSSCEEEVMLSVDQTSINISDAGGSQTVTLTANKPWSASSNQSWCKVSPSSGEEATSSRITISCDPNTTYDARNATVTFTCAELTKQVSITQTMNNGLMVSQTTYEVTKAAQQLNIEVKTNVKFSVEIDNGCKDWVKYNTTKALTTSTVILDIAENTSYDGREGKVTIKQDGGSLSSTITIKQNQLDGLFLTTSEYNLSNEKHTLTVEVSTNVELEVKPEADWVKYVQTKGLSTKQIVLDVAENDTYEQRETKVNVRQKNGDLSGVITIIQDERFGILVSQSEYNLTNEEQTIEVEVKYNVDFEVSIPDGCKDWIKQVSTKGLNTKYCTFSIAKNDTYDNREGNITFKQQKGAMSTTVAIKQAQTDCLFAEKKEYVVSFEEQILDIKIKSNIAYQVHIDEDCKDWINQLQTKALTDSILSFSIQQNDGINRIGKVSLLSDVGLTETITINQDEKYNITISPNEIKLNNSEQSFTVTVKSNFEFEVLIPDEARNWLTLVQTKGLAEKELLFRVSENKSDDIREALVAINQKGGDITSTFSIVQMTKEAEMVTGVNGDKYLLYNNLRFYIKSTEEYTVGFGSVEGACPAKLVIPQSITYKGNILRVVEIGWEAFKGQAYLQSLTIPSSVIKIWQAAFEGCTGLKELIINDSEQALQLTYQVKVQNLQYDGPSKGMFYDCPLESVYMGRDLDYEDDWTYALYCGYSPFYKKTELKSFVFSNYVTRIRRRFLEGCSGLSKLVLSDNIVTIGGGAFAACRGLIEVVLPSKLESMEHSVFESTSIKTVHLPSSLKFLPHSTFAFCTSLEEIYIHGLEKIEGNVFMDCEKISKIYCYLTTPPEFILYASDAINPFATVVYTEATLYVPKQSIDTYKAAEGWKKIWDIQSLPE